MRSIFEEKSCSQRPAGPADLPVIPASSPAHPRVAATIIVCGNTDDGGMSDRQKQPAPHAPAGAPVPVLIAVVPSSGLSTSANLHWQFRFCKRASARWAGVSAEFRRVIRLPHGCRYTGGSCSVPDKSSMLVSKATARLRLTCAAPWSRATCNMTLSAPQRARMFRRTAVSYVLFHCANCLQISASELSIRAKDVQAIRDMKWLPMFTGSCVV